MKRTIIIIAIILFGLAVAGLSVYLLFFQNQGVPELNEEYEANVNQYNDYGQLVPSANSNYEWPPPENGEAANGELLNSPEDYETPSPEQVKLEVNRVLNVQAMEPTLSASGNEILYYNPDVGEFYRSDLDGKSIEQITQANLSNVYDIEWSPTKDKVVIVFSKDDGATRKNIILNLADQKVTELDSRLQSIVFSPNGEEIFYRYYDPANDVAKLATATTSGEDWKEVNVQSGNTAPTLLWYKDKKLAYYPAPSGYRQAQLYRVNPDGSDMEVLSSYGYGVEAMWSPNASRFLYIVFDQASVNMTLTTSNDDLSNQRILGIDTLLEKCAWAYDNIHLYCGAQNVFQNSNVLPDDYLNEKILTLDTFFKVNTDSNKVTKIASSEDFEGRFDAFEPFMSTDNHRMYFTNRYDNKLYVLIMP